MQGGKRMLSALSVLAVTVMFTVHPTGPVQECLEAPSILNSSFSAPLGDAIHPHIQYLTCSA